MALLALACAAVLAFRKNIPVFLIEHGIYKVFVVFGLRIPSHVLSMIDVLVLSLFSVISIAFILRSFRKTVSPEVFFFAFWLASLSFESLRLLHLLFALAGMTDSFLAVTDKLYMGVRFFGFIAVFISGLYAAGMRNEKQFSILGASAGISVALVSILPVNTGIWERTLLFRLGYSQLITGFTVAIILITIANYLVAVRMRGDRAYFYIALGIAAVTAGDFLAGRDISPLGSLVALALMAAGTFVYIYKLHSYYLWQ